jgi:hypothetical protein
VFVRSGSSWSRQQELIAADGTDNDYFGISVTLSSDGSTALIAADEASNTPGAAYVFVRSGSSWSQQQKLTASDRGSGDDFGASMALSSDGSTALIGASGQYGEAYVFVRSGSSWSQQQELTTTDDAGFDLFGSSVALSSDGNTALIGAPLHPVAGNVHGGAAYVFVRNGSSWSQQQQLIAFDSASNNQFGTSVALSSGGSTALVGDPEHTVDGNAFQGAAYVFVGQPIGGPSATRTPAPTATATATPSPTTAPSRTPTSSVTRTATPARSTTATPSSTTTATGTPTGTPAPSQSARVSVAAGWNLIDLPLASTTPFSASTILKGVLQQSGGALAAIYGLSAGRWSPSLIQRGSSAPIGTDFPLQPGAGYLFYSDRAGSYLQSGTLPATQPAWTLTRGWNLVGSSLGAPSPISASTALEGVLQSSGGNLAALYALHNGQWSAPVIVRRGGVPSGTDFPLQPGLGYLLYTDRGTSYTPGATSVTLRWFRPASGSHSGSAQPPPHLP